MTKYVQMCHPRIGLLTVCDNGEDVIWARPIGGSQKTFIGARSRLPIVLYDIAMLPILSGWLDIDRETGLGTYVAAWINEQLRQINERYFLRLVEED